MQTYESDTNIGSIKILAVDMDKTLLTDKRVLPQVFCPASGRPAPKLEEMFESIKNRLAFCPDNGACVIYRGSYIYKSNIDVALYQQVLTRASEDPRAVPVLCCYDEFYVLARDHQYYNTINYVDTFEGLDIESNKISIFFPGYDAEPAFRETYNPAFSDQLYVTNAGREWIDFMNLGVDKGSGVAHLCDHLGIDIADAAAVGDTYNDIPMLERVGHSFIVDNAEEHMNAHAKWRIPSNNVPSGLAGRHGITFRSVRSCARRKPH